MEAEELSGFDSRIWQFTSIDLFRANDGLLFPGEEILHRILIGKIAVEQSIVHLRGFDRANRLLRNDDRALRRTLGLVQDHGLAFVLVRPKHLINEIGRSFSSGAA